MNYRFFLLLLIAFLFIVLMGLYITYVKLIMHDINTLNRLKREVIEDKIVISKFKYSNLKPINNVVLNPSIYWSNNQKNEIKIVYRLSNLKCIPNLKLKDNLVKYGYDSYLDDAKIVSVHDLDRKIDFLNKKDVCYSTILSSTFLGENDFSDIVNMSNITENSKINTKHKAIGIEDPRLFYFNNNIWVISNIITNNVLDKHKYDIVLFPIDKPTNFNIVKYEYRNKNDKNWISIVHKDILYIIYSLQPYKLLNIDRNWNCTTLYEENIDFCFNMEIGNGSCPINTKFNNENVYIGVAHIRNTIRNQKIRKNFFYMLEGEPPFRPKYVSDIFNFSKEFKNIEFATGLIEDDNNFYISYGIDDYMGAIAKIHKEHIYSMMKYIPNYHKQNEPS
jgi:predicted GH43/DUF377 family glycosyl hydrolase